MLWFTVLIFNQREINYSWQMDRSKGEKEDFDWHCYSSQHFLPEGIASDLVMPGMLGTPPLLATPLWSFSLLPILYSVQRCSWPLSELKAWQWSSNIYHQRRIYLCFWSRTLYSLFVWAWVWVNVRENRPCLKQQKSNDSSLILPSGFTDALQISFFYI